MEDFFVDYFPGIEFNNARISVAIKDISTILESTKRNDFDLLCAIATLVKESSHGFFIVKNNDFGFIRNTWISKDYRMVEVLEKFFGFSPSYVEKIVRVSNKFLSAVDCGDYKYKFDICKDLTISKMIELLPLSDLQIQFAFSDKKLTYKSTSKDIRDYVKALKTSSKDNKVLEENNTSAVDCGETKVSDNGLFIKLEETNFEYVKKVVNSNKDKFKDANAFLNTLIEYAISNKLFI